jgi:hypothetical protein
MHRAVPVLIFIHGVEFTKTHCQLNFNLQTQQRKKLLGRKFQQDAAL